MTGITTPIVYCDGPIDECPYEGEAARTAIQEVHTVTQLRKILRGDGWRNRGSVDICPYCWEAGYRPNGFQSAAREEQASD